MFTFDQTHKTMKILFAFATLLSACGTANHTPTTMETAIQQSPSIHQFKVPSIEGGTIDFASFKGKKVLVVNTASECGYTRQYEGLEKLYEANKDKLVIVGFPANNFGGQEPGNNEQIQEFCKVRYGVKFPLASKVDVVGEKTHPLFAWLTHKDQNGVLDATIKWNFNKFLLDENGKLLEYFPSKTEPEATEITKYLN